MQLKNEAEPNEKFAKNLYKEKNNEILQLKKRLELLEESCAEMVSVREGKLEELEKQLKNKDEEIKWLQERLKSALGEEQYHSQIEINYLSKFKN